MDKISIITATYNCVDEIEATIKSVLDQDYSNIEYIIIDGASDDGTVDIIKKYSEKISYWISEPDDGLYYAMNKGIKIASGDWIYIHNAGNLFHDPSVLTKIFSNNLCHIDAVYGYIYSNDLGKYLRNPKPFFEMRDNYRRSMGFSHQGIFIRTEWAKRFPFDTIHYKCCADYNQVMQLYNNEARFTYLDIPICYSAPAGFSERNRKLQYREMAKINGVYGSLRFYYSYSIFSIKRIVKKIFKIK